MNNPETASVSIHPWAWWGWALCLGGIASLTNNPLLLILLATAITCVLLLRKSDSPWAKSVSAYFLLALCIIGVRIFFQILLGSGDGNHILFTLPEIPLPQWAAGIRLGGAVSAEGLLYTVYDALRLGVMLLALGAANALANPRQALRSVPGALYESSVAVVIALSVAPQLIESTRRVRKARRLRGGKTRGLAAVPALVIPVLADAIERSIGLAAGMESRGFASTRQRTSNWVLALLLGSLLLVAIGAFSLLGTDAVIVATLLLLLGVSGVIIGLRISGHSLRVTRFNPPAWGLRETALLGCGIAALALTVLQSVFAYNSLHPTTNPLIWPQLPLPMLGVFALVVAVLLPTMPRRISATDAALPPNLVPSNPVLPKAGASHAEIPPTEPRRRDEIHTSDPYVAPKGRGLAHTEVNNPIQHPATQLTTQRHRLRPRALQLLEITR